MAVCGLLRAGMPLSPAMAPALSRRTKTNRRLMAMENRTISLERAVPHQRSEEGGDAEQCGAGVWPMEPPGQSKSLTGSQIPEPLAEKVENIGEPRRDQRGR
jgi:hypothetical protein